MSGEVEHVEPLGSPGQTAEASPAPKNRDGYGRRAWMIAGALIIGFGFLVCYILFFSDLLSSHCPSREDYTRVKVKTIDLAIVYYKDQHGDYPPSLEKLAVPEEEGKAILDRDSLMDEWGKPFRYDLRDRHPTTDRPKVYTISPEGKVISNW